MGSNNCSEKGHTIVEATFVYPVVIFTFIAIFYAALFLYKKANLQANLGNAVVYYKNEKTDTFVSMLDCITKDSDFLIGNRYDKPEYKNPYRNIGSVALSALSGLIGGNDNSKAIGRIGSFVRKSYGMSDVTITSEQVKDYYLFKTIEVTGSKKEKSALNIAIIGGKNSVNIGVKAKVTVIDADNIIRDIDFATDLISDTKLGRMIEEKKGQIKAGYEKFIGKLKK